MLRTVRRLGLLPWIALLAGCACTQEGCDNRIRFNPGVDLEPSIPYEVEACLDGSCQHAILTAGDDGRAAVVGALSLWADGDYIDLALGDGDLDGPHAIAFSVTDEAGRSLATQERQVELTRTQPNGALCPPTCWSAELSA